MTVAYRDAGDEDRRFVIDAWASSFQFAHTAGMIGVGTWFRVMIPEIERVLDRAGTRTLVAYETSETGRLADLYGFLAADTTPATPVVFYAYVKEPYRRRGLARGLFEAAGIDPLRPFAYTCTTGVVSKIYGARKIPLARWEPLIARFPPEDQRRPRRAR